MANGASYGGGAPTGGAYSGPQNQRTAGDDIADAHTAPLEGSNPLPFTPTQQARNPLPQQAPPHISAPLVGRTSGGPEISSGAHSAPLNLVVPPRPTTVAETGLDLVLLEELALKHIVAAGIITGGELAQRLRLPLNDVVEEAVMALRRDNLVEHISASVNILGAATMKLRATERGVQVERAAREQSGYIGPAPVPLKAFEQVLRRQAMSQRTVKRADVWRRLAHLVLPDETVDELGAALESGGPVLLYGHSGNGKTAIGASIARMYGGGVLLPHAVSIDGHIVRIFDPSVHQPLPLDASLAGGKMDERWMFLQAPAIRLGGSLRLEQLDLRFNEQQRIYDCPMQLKAACGVLFVDDLGTQTGSLEDLVTRLLEPLAMGADYLTTSSGRQVALPFTPLLVFATAREPAEALSPSLLRRLPCKIIVQDPTEEHYRELFRRACQANGIEFSASGLDYVIERCYIKGNRSARACHPAELLRLVCAAARYYGTQPHLAPQLIDMAANMYFV